MLVPNPSPTLISLTSYLTFELCRESKKAWYNFYVNCKVSSISSLTLLSSKVRYAGKKQSWREPGDKAS